MSSKDYSHLTNMAGIGRFLKVICIYLHAVR